MHRVTDHDATSVAAIPPTALTHGMKKRFRPSVFSMLYLWEGFMVFISHN